MRDFLELRPLVMAMGISMFTALLMAPLYHPFPVAAFCCCLVAVCVRAQVAQLHLTLCDSMDYTMPGSSVHGIIQARTLEWVAIPFSSTSS